MISNIWSALTVVRHAVAITIVMSAAGATVAGSVHGPSADHAQAASTTTNAGVSVARTTTPVTSELEHQTTLSVNGKNEQTATEHTTRNEPKPVETTKPVTVGEPKHENTATTSNDETLSVLVKDCLVKYAAAKNAPEETSPASEACRKAIAASRLSPKDFWLRFGPKATPTAKPEPTKKPETTKRPEPVKPTTTMTTAQIEVLVKDCFAKYVVAKNTKEGGDAAVEACHKAMAASGLTGDAFWARFGRPGSN